MTTYWIFNGVDKPPTPITFIGVGDHGWLRFVDENGEEQVNGSSFLDGLDPEIFDEDGDYLWDSYHSGDPGDPGDWWVNVPFSTKEKALAARRAAVDSAIESLELRIQASLAQTHEDLEEIKRLDHLEETQEAEYKRPTYESEED